VTEGWLLFRENSSLTRLTTDENGKAEPIPTPDPVGVGPDGRLTLHNRQTIGSGNVSREECDRDRVALSMIDDDRYIRETLIPAANRANATFYTVDPRGLPVFDNAIGPA